MSLFDCGYYMKQEYIRPFVMRPIEGHEYNSIALVIDLRVWWLGLPSHKRAGVPIPNMYVHDPDSDPNKSYDDGVIYIRTRRAVPAAEIEDFSETDTDRDVKDKFLQAIGDKFDPEELTLFVKPHTFT